MGSAPIYEPVVADILDQVGNDDGAAVAMEGDHLLHRETGAYENLIRVRRARSALGVSLNSALETDLSAAFAGPAGRRGGRQERPPFLSAREGR